MIQGASQKKILILFYSFSGQTNGLLHNLASGIKESGADVMIEKILPVEPLRFPVGSVLSTVKMMLTTFVRNRVPVREISGDCFKDFDLIILAGPTWSYNPSGPVLALLDRYGTRLFNGKKVLPLISCRGYWRAHWFGLRSLLRQCGAEVVNLMVFSHPCVEPWRTLGVFLKIAGKNPERGRFLGRVYKKFGHTKDQFDEASRFGKMIGEALQSNQPLNGIDFRTKTALP